MDASPIRRSIPKNQPPRSGGKMGMRPFEPAAPAATPVKCGPELPCLICVIVLKNVGGESARAAGIASTD
jgi:hypothetical protein